MIIFILKGRVEFNGTYREFQNKGGLEKIVDDETNEDVSVEENVIPRKISLKNISEEIVEHSWSDDPTSCRIRRASLMKYERRQSSSLSISHAKSMHEVR